MSTENIPAERQRPSNLTKWVVYIGLSRQYIKQLCRYLQREYNITLQTTHKHVKWHAAHHKRMFQVKAFKI